MSVIDEKTKKMIENYNKGLELYRNKQFKESIACFENALELVPDDGPSAMYIERCKEYIKNPPPENWDGVFIMKTK